MVWERERKRFRRSDVGPHDSCVFRGAELLDQRANFQPGIQLT
jgi:hypothetical protein